MRAAPIVNRPAAAALLAAAAIAASAIAAARLAGERIPPPAAAITIDYPLDGSVFPPEFPPPTFIWRDAGSAGAWRIDVEFADGKPGIEVRAAGERMRIGEIDPRCVAPTNELPKLTPEQADARTWTPDVETWTAIKRRSIAHPATVTIAGVRGNPGAAVSRGRVMIQTSTDPVGAPIFYRDVPLMPSELEKGIIKPLAPKAVPLIAWRLRDVGEPRSRLLMEGLHTCANCHSFSRDGSTMAMDVDGPQNDKGLYAIVSVKPHTSIRNEDIVAWSSFRGRLGGKLRVGFMSQLSPDGQYVVTTINDPGADQPDFQRRKNPTDVIGNYYVANFKDYRFLQVFYATRGILAWYSKSTGRLEPLPGADDPRYVHSNAAWSPDGKYLVFARAEAKDAYPVGSRMAEYANDPRETPIRYDLYRVPFNGGKGGKAEPVAGASRNGMSNSFPKISPDGRWIVFVQCRNGLLMRPDSRLYIVPFEGGTARAMRCNTPLMNSWHSFSPNGRWLVFSSKARSPYTQMYLTHLDENGADSPAILIDNATAANRAVNLPEFVNIPARGLVKMDAPATDFYGVFDLAVELAAKRQYEAAIREWKRARELNAGDARVHNNLAVALLETGRVAEARASLEKALAISPGDPDAHNNLAIALVRSGKLAEAIPHFEKALEANPGSARAHSNLARVLAETGRVEEAIRRYQKALEIDPADAEAHNNLAIALAGAGRLDEAVRHLELAVAASPGSFEFHSNLGRFLVANHKLAEAIPHFERAAALSAGKEARVLDILAAAYAEAGRFSEAADAARRALALATQHNDAALAEALKARIARYDAEAGRASQQ